MKHIVITGNPVNGFKFEGPFADRDDAVRYAEGLYDWWIADLDAPELVTIPDIFDPAQDFASPSDAVYLCFCQDDPQAALMEIVAANVSVDEFGFAAECIQEFGDRL